MKLSILAAAAITQLASAHYFFESTIMDGQESRPYQFIRENTRQIKYYPTKWKNTFDDLTPDLPDFRCNKGTFSSASRTSTLPIKAGSKLAMKLGVRATMEHPGPSFVYMSKAPGAASQYEGEGEWFKIHETGVCDKSKDFKGPAWCTWAKNNVEFTVPKDVPDGEYLIRAEHIAIHGAHVGEAEFYYACAQVKVTGGGTGKPGPMVKFPGAYKQSDPSFNFSIYGGYKEYPMPGPAVWGGGGSGGGSSGSDSSGSGSSGSGSSGSGSSGSDSSGSGSSGTGSSSGSPGSGSPGSGTPVGSGSPGSGSSGSSSSGSGSSGSGSPGSGSSGSGGSDAPGSGSPGSGTPTSSDTPTTSSPPTDNSSEPSTLSIKANPTSSSTTSILVAIPTPTPNAPWKAPSGASPSGQDASHHGGGWSAAKLPRNRRSFRAALHE